MKLMVSSYNNGAVDWNAEAEETTLRSYRVEHGFNGPAKCIITLADPTGAMMRKYNAEDNDVYIGVGKITLEDPTGTDIFYGRIKRVTANSADRTVTLECADWLDQLDDEKITYDMREKLGTTDMRQSKARADVDTTKSYLRKGPVSTLWSAQADDGGAFTDETTVANDFTEDDMTLLPAVPVIGDAYYFGFETKVSTMKLYISQQGDWVGTLAWKYWDGGAWAILGKTSPANDRWNFEQAVGLDTYVFTAGGDWATVAVNGVTAYWIRAEVATYTGITTQPLGRNCFAEYYLYDDGEYDTAGGMAFANDAYNGMNLIFTAGMAGTKIWRFHPHASTATGYDVYGDDVHQVWVNDAGVDVGFADNDWTLQYDFQTNLGHNTPSDFYVHDSLTAARIKCVHQISQLGGGNHGTLHIWDNNAADWSAAISALAENDVRTEMTHSIPEDILPYIVDANGMVKILYDIDRTAGNATLSVSYLELELDTVTTGYSTAITITDTQNPNRLQLPVDITTPATCMWDEIPYCIVKEIYLHLEAATGPFLGGDTIVTLTAGAANIENTTGISTTQFKDKSRLKIAQAVALEDAGVFWITLGGSTVTYKKTFGADTMQLTDGSVLDWQSLHDYTSMFNSYKVYGARLGDYEIYQLAEDAASKTKFLSTKNKVIRNAGLVSDTEALAIGTALAAKQHEVPQMVGCTIHGNTATAAHATTIKLGEIVEITSSYLWPNAAKDYIVSQFIYDSGENKTYLTLYPKASTGEPEIKFPNPQIDTMKEQAEAEKYTPDPLTHEVA